MAPTARTISKCPLLSVYSSMVHVAIPTSVSHTLVLLQVVNELVSSIRADDGVGKKSFKIGVLIELAGEGARMMDATFVYEATWLRGETCSTTGSGGCNLFSPCTSFGGEMTGGIRCGCVS